MAMASMLDLKSSIFEQIEMIENFVKNQNVKMRGFTFVYYEFE